MSVFEGCGFFGVCPNGFPEAAAVLMMVLLLLLGEAEFGVEHVLWAHEMAERRGEGCVHFGFNRFYGLLVACC